MSKIEVWFRNKQGDWDMDIYNLSGITSEIIKDTRRIYAGTGLHLSTININGERVWKNGQGILDHAQGD